jgi:hypothetical protein
LTQGQRQITVDYPVSADWSGTGVHIGDAGDALPGDRAAYDPASGTLTALSEGTAVLSVTVNGVTATTEVTVTD